MPTQTVVVNSYTFPLVSSSVSETSASFIIPADSLYSDIKTAFGTNKGDILIEYDGTVMQTVTGFTKLVKIVDAMTTYEVSMEKEYDDAEALAIITAGQHPSIDEAQEIRESLEGMTVYIPDEDAEKDTWAFPAWDGNGHVYTVGDRVQYMSLLYKVVQSHTSQPSWTPDTTPALFARISDPTEEWPEWIQPTGAQDAYALGDKVSHNEKHWVSNTNANTWEPGVYGWDEHTEA